MRGYQCGGLLIVVVIPTVDHRLGLDFFMVAREEAVAV
jgi:hypothetical protein